LVSISSVNVPEPLSRLTLHLLELVFESFLNALHGIELVNYFRVDVALLFSAILRVVVVF
jgi:hypothetical protein